MRVNRMRVIMVVMMPVPLSVLMAIPVFMVMVMVMVETMRMLVGVQILMRKTAKTGAEGIAKLAVDHIRPWRRRSLAFDMMVVAFLDRADFGLEPHHGDSVFTQDTGGRWDVAKGWMSGAILGRDLLHRRAVRREDLRAVSTCPAIGGRVLSCLFDYALGERGQHLGVVAQIGGFDKGDIRVFGSHLIGKAVNSVDQNAREQEIGKYDDTLVGQPGDMLQTGFDQRECDAGITHLDPTKPHALLNHPGNL